MLISASSTDAMLASLRRDILARGGCVFHNFLPLRGQSAMVPARALPALAARAPAGSGLGMDGAGVGIATLDSGSDWRHQNTCDAAVKSRVRTLVDQVAMVPPDGPAEGRPGLFALGACEPGWRRVHGRQSVLGSISLPGHEHSVVTGGAAHTVPASIVERNVPLQGVV